MFEKEQYCVLLRNNSSGTLVVAAATGIETHKVKIAVATICAKFFLVLFL